MTPTPSISGTSCSRPTTFFSIIFTGLIVCSAQAAQLKVTSSADADSNAVQSFVVVPANTPIPHGIKHDAAATTLSTQIPFVIELDELADASSLLQWQITLPSRHVGNIELISNFPGQLCHEKNSLVWRSPALAHTVLNRQQLVFRPDLPTHQPVIYRRGLSANGERHPQGGGTRLIDDAAFNPRLSYQIQLNILNHNKITSMLAATLRMDDKDLIRQEYINHYDIKRYGFGKNGNLPVPLRNEISVTPEKPANIIGNPLTESAYGMLVDDGMLELAQKVSTIFSAQQNFYRHNIFFDRNNKPLSVPPTNLWLSGGWRNPERNEWFSNAANGIHQRGGAIDIIPNEPPGDIKSAIIYWVLWQGLEQNKKTFDAYWQLETNGRPMRTREFIEDIDPINGIPDAFDKADHLHINIHYDTAVDE